MKPSPLTFRSLIGRTDEQVDAAVPVVREILPPAGEVRAVYAGVAAGALTTSSPTSVAFSGVAPDPVAAPESSGDFWSD